MDLNLSGLITVVIGGTNGIGLANAKGFLDEGAIIHIISRNRNAEIIRELSTEYPDTVFFHNCDATDREALEVTRKAIIDKAAKIDIVVSNVGNGSGSSSVIGSDEEWNSSWDINFKSALNAASVFSDELIKSKGVLIFISSIAGMEFLGAPTSYSTAKSALISFAKSLSHRLAPDVRVNVVSPGNIWVSEGTWDRKMQEQPEKIARMLNEKVPLKRFGLPSEVNDLVLFLSSPKAAFITGACFVIDGGQTVSF